MAHRDPMTMVRVSQAQWARAQALVPKVAARVGQQRDAGMAPRISGAAVVRLALARGLAELEALLGEGDPAARRPVETTRGDAAPTPPP